MIKRIQKALKSKQNVRKVPPLAKCPKGPQKKLFKNVVK
jgi:hypothetical protein